MDGKKEAHVVKITRKSIDNLAEVLHQYIATTALAVFHGLNKLDMPGTSDEIAEKESIVLENILNTANTQKFIY